jgi:dTDP-4-amino-4,6-dideoxygalactose transaminase
MSSSLAALGGKKVREKSFPAWPHYDETEREAVNRVLDSRNWWANQGVEVKEFEKEWSDYTGAKGSFAVTNGSHTLEVIFLALGIGDGDEVIVADWSFLATIGAILTVNAIPKIVDVDPLTGTIDVAQAEAAIGPKTRAIVCVHVAGSMSDMDALTALCKKHNIALVEDSAHAHGSRWKGEHAGTIGDAGSFSFQSSKLMTSGEGGVITTRREDLIPMFKSFINCGRGDGIWYYRHLRLGGNYRLSEWQGAILRAQLNRFPDQQKNRADNANWLNSEIGKIPGFKPQGRYAGCTDQGNYCYVVEVEPSLLSGASRDQVRHALLAEGMPLTTAYPPLHKLEMFKDPSGLAPRLRGEVTKIRYNEQSFPVTDYLAANTLWFKTEVLMGSRDDANSVLQSIAKISEHASEVAKIDAPSW